MHWKIYGSIYLYLSYPSLALAFSCDNMLHWHDPNSPMILRIYLFNRWSNAKATTDGIPTKLRDVFKKLDRDNSGFIESGMQFSSWALLCFLNRWSSRMYALFIIISCVTYNYLSSMNFWNWPILCITAELGRVLQLMGVDDEDDRDAKVSIE